MPKLQTISDVEAALLPYMSVTREATGKDVAVIRAQKLLDAIGNPERGQHVIHVAGTSGKTSTTTYIAALLLAAGKRVGHTVSPHLDSVAERVQINGHPLDEATFCAYSSRFLDLIADYSPMPSWHEYFTVFALWVFAQECVDYTVLETGVGGLYDASNVITATDKVCVITDIGYDHQNLLGTSIGQIARQKAGIIHQGNTVFMHRQNKQVGDVVRSYADRQRASLHAVAPLGTIGALPGYQARNWALAAAVYDYVAGRDRLPQLEYQQRVDTQTIVIPGRMEPVRIGNTTLIMDGAHNPQKMTAFADSFAGQYPDARVPVLLAIKDGKDIQDTVRPLASIASHIIVTTFSPIAGVHTLAAKPERVARALDAVGMSSYTLIPNLYDAYRALTAQAGTCAIVTGSFYLLSEVRRLIAQNNTPNLAPHMHVHPGKPTTPPK